MIVNAIIVPFLGKLTSEAFLFFFQSCVKSTRFKCETPTSYLEIPVCSGAKYRLSLRNTWQSRPGFEILPTTSFQRRKAVSEMAINLPRTKFKLYIF